MAEVDPPIEPSAGEAANGWTPTTLAAYVAERQAAASKTVLERRPPLPARCNSKYSVFRWRKSQ